MASKHQTITFSKKDIVEPAKKLLKNKGYTDFGNNKENEDEYNSEKDMSIPYLDTVPNMITMREVDNEQHSPEQQTHSCNKGRHDGADAMRKLTRKTLVHEDDKMPEIINVVKNISKENRKHPRITFVDFGGQSVYYAFHQIFLSPKTFYILVVDMTKSPDEKVHETEDKCGSRFSTWTYKGYLNFFLSLITF